MSARSCSWSPSGYGSSGIAPATASPAFMREAASFAYGNACLALRIDAALGDTNSVLAERVAERQHGALRGGRPVSEKLDVDGAVLAGERDVCSRHRWSSIPSFCGGCICTTS